MLLVQSTFSEDVILTILDKGLLGLIIVGATLLANRMLENFKSTQTRQTEVLKLRFAAMAETWSVIYRWDLEAVNTMEKVTRRQPHPEAKKELSTSAQNVIQIIEKNRWLNGPAFTNDAIGYVNETVHYFDTLTGEAASSPDAQLKDRSRSIVTDFAKYLDQ